MNTDAQHGYSMPCPCGGPTGVIDTRTTVAGTIRRRRCCKKCGTRFTTYEVREGAKPPDRTLISKLKSRIEMFLLLGQTMRDDILAVEALEKAEREEGKVIPMAAPNE